MQFHNSHIDFRHSGVPPQDFQWSHLTTPMKLCLVALKICLRANIGSYPNPNPKKKGQFQTYNVIQSNLNGLPFAACSDSLLINVPFRSAFCSHGEVLSMECKKVRWIGVSLQSHRHKTKGVLSKTKKSRRAQHHDSD